MGGIKISENFDEVMVSIRQEVALIQKELEDDKAVRQCLKNIGKALQKHVKKFAPNHSLHPSYSDVYSKSMYKHIKDDVQYSVKKSRLSKQLYVSVHGGDWTGYKWLWVNDGHTTQKGEWIPGTHFVDKAVSASQDEISQIVDEYIKEALGNNG